MDKVQIYYLVLLVLDGIVKVYRGTINRDESRGTWGELLLWYPVGLAMGVPVIGRMFGWW